VTGWGFGTIFSERGCERPCGSIDRGEPEKAGFVFDRQKGSHEVHVRTTEAGSTTSVMPVHRGRTLKRGTLHGLIDDMGLSTQEFIDLL
jgi:predicted RNA binding protein YcfA (HicA-like mRNA interferase family)